MFQTAAPGPVDGISGHCSVIVWKEPKQPNGVITNYTVVLFTKDDEVPNETNSAQTFYVIEYEALLPKGNPIFVTVRSTFL